MALKDVKSRIASVKNIQKITRAMEMVAAARLRRAEQRIEALRPYAGAIRRMTRQAAEAAGNVPNLPILNEHESEDTVAILLVTGRPRPRGRVQLADRARRHPRRASSTRAAASRPIWYASGRRGVSSLAFRGREAKGAYTGFTDRPAYAQRARHRLRPDGGLHRRRGRPRRDRLQPLRVAADPGGHARDAAAAAAGDDPRGRRRPRRPRRRGGGRRLRRRRQAGAGRVRARSRGRSSSA